MSEIIVVVPGPWEEHRDLIRALADAHGMAYLFAGAVLMETETRLACRLELSGRQEGTREAFQRAGLGRVTAETLDAVQAHRSTVDLFFDVSGYEGARTAARFTRALLQAGGIAALVETAGIAHAAEKWIETGVSDDPYDIYSLFVQLVGGDGQLYSCGMHNFGLPDTAVTPADDVDRAAYLLTAFNLYRMVETPVLHDGETFSTDAESPRHRMTHGPYPADYPPDTPLHNPHGLWTLRPAAEPSERRRRWWRFGG